MHPNSPRQMPVDAMLNIVRASPLFNRVHMAKMLVKGGNVLLLDEPTNDLEVETLRALEEALESFAGWATTPTGRMR